MAEVTERELDFLRRVSRFETFRFTDREEDRTRQRMRKLGYVRFDGLFRRWEITPAGADVAISALQEP